MRLFDSPGDTVAEITTDGSTIKPFLNAVNELVREARVEFRTDGLFVNAIDSANVAMGKFFLDAAEFEEYELAEETKVGVDLKEAKKLVRRARKGKPDELKIHVQQYELTATVSRGYENTDVVSQGTMQLIDPDSIRGEPDTPNEWDTQTVDVPADAFTDALGYAMGAADHVELTAQGVNQHADALYIGGETDTREEQAAISGVEVGEQVEGLYSANYMSNLLGVIGEVEPQNVTLDLAVDFPLQAEFRMDGFEVEFMVAPRIQQ
jgi:proliferating cell nuclear antigen